MKKYTLIASRDTFESKEAEHYLDLAAELMNAGNDVTVFLVQNGVLNARASSGSARVSKLAEAGVAVLADSFSLRERGISTDHLAVGVRAGEIDIVVDHLAAGHKVMWN